MLLGLFAGVLAQTCAAMLPAPYLEYEWFRDGQPYAYDTVIRASGSQRVYRRRMQGGATSERVLSCSSHEGATYLTERSTGGVVRIFTGLETGEARTVSGATIRRIRTPQGAAANTIWFSVSNPGIKLYALRRGAGITEVRTPRRGGASVLRAVVRDPRPEQRAAAQAESVTKQVAELQEETRRLTDSIATLQNVIRQFVLDCMASNSALPARERALRCRTDMLPP